MTMPNDDLISRTYIINEIGNWFNSINYQCVDPYDAVLLETENETLASVIESIEAAPAVDAEHVKHGKWEFDNHACGYYMSGCVCSLCGYGVMISANYCPKCGAKMDLE